GLTGDDVGHQAALGSSAALGDDDRLAQAGMPAQCGGDLLGLNPYATNLDLVVQTPQVLQAAVRAPAHPVAGAVQSGAGVGTERVRKEPLGGQAGTTQVTAGQARSTDEQLTWHANRHQLQVRVDDVDLCIGNWVADGHVAIRYLHQVRCGPNCRLSWSVHVVKLS